MDADHECRDWIATRMAEHRYKARQATGMGEAYQRGMADAYEKLLAQLGGRRKERIGS